MRLLSAIPLLALLCITAFAQNDNLPDMLRPDAALECEARRMGAKIVKLLPSELLYKNSPTESHDDRDFPLGIRGSGAFFSFSTQSHSFNKFPEISLRDSRLVSGPSTTLTLLRDLGDVDLSYLTRDTPEASKLVDYKPPRYLAEIPREREKLYGVPGDGRLYIVPKVGGTYLYRALTFEKSDVVVAFKVLASDRDGSVTLAWKELHRLPRPIALYMPDEVLQSKVDQLIADEGIDCDKVVVKDNHLYFVSDSSRPSRNRGNEQLGRSMARLGISYRGAGGSIPK